VPSASLQTVSERDLILIVSGRDQPGVLDEVTHFTADRGAGVRAIRVSNLGGWFGLVIALQADDRAAMKIEHDLQVLRDRAGVQASVQRPLLPQGRIARFDLHATGGFASDAADESEVLRQSGNLLRVLNVNIAELTTRPGGEQAPFGVDMKLDVPTDVPAGKFRELLGQLFDGLGVRWELASTAATL
jgi:glycine cleavage system regulatory protein